MGRRRDETAKRCVRRCVGAVVGLVVAASRARGTVVTMDLRSNVSRERWRDVVASANVVAYVVAPEGRARTLAARALEAVDRELTLESAGSIERAPKRAFAIATRATIGERGYRAFEDFFAPARAAAASADASERDVLVVVHRPDADDERVVRRASCAIDDELDVDDERSRACFAAVRDALAAALAPGPPSLEM